MAKLNIPDEFFQLDWAGQGPSVSDQMIAEWKALGAFATNRDQTLDEYFSAMQKGARRTMEESVTKEIQEQRAALDETLNTMMNEDPAQFQEVAPVASEAYQAVEQEATNPLLPIKAELRKLANPDMTEKDIEFQAEQAYYQMIMRQSFDQDWGKTAMDVVGYIFYPNESLLSARMTEDGSWWKPHESLERNLNAFYSLELPDRLNMFVDLVDEVKSKTDNSIKAQNLLNRIIDPEALEEAKLDLLWDQLAAVGTIADVATLGALGIAKANRIRLVSKELKNADLAVDAAIAASRSDEVATALGADRVGAAAHLSPINLSDEIMGGAPSTVKEAVARRMAENEAMLRGLERSVLEEGLDVLVDQPKAHQRMIDEIYAAAPVELKSVQVVESTPKGAVLRYTHYDPDGTARPMAELDAMSQVDAMGSESYRIVNRTDTNFEVEFTLPGETEARRISYDYPDTGVVYKEYVLDDITGGFRAEGFNPMTTLGSYLASPQLKFGKDMDTLVNPFSRMIFQSAKYRNTLNARFRQLYSMNNTKGRERVAHALEQGALREEVFDYHTLRDVYNLTDKDVEQYHAFRGLMDQAHALKSKEIRERLLAQGLKQWDDVSGTFDSRYYVKTYDTPDSAKAVIEGSDFTHAVIMTPEEPPRPINLRAGKDGGVVMDKVNELFNEGYVLIRNGQAGTAFKIVEEGDSYSGFLFVKRTTIKDIGYNVLNYRKGYIPLVYGPDANYFGQQAIYGSIDGVTKQVGTRTHVYFSSKADAEDWARKRNYEHLLEKYDDPAKALSRLDDPNEQLPFTIKYDREMNAQEFEHVASMGMGGLYTGPRGTQRLRRGLGEEAPEFIDVFESMQRYMDNISNNLPMASFRVGIEDKWMKHAKEVGALPADYSKGFRDAYWDIKRSDTLDSGIQKFLLEAHDHISYNVRVPTLGEREIASWTRSFAESLEKINIPALGLGREGAVTKALHRLDHSNPIDAMRSATFHTLLGVYNPAQLIVQGMGSTVAISADPTIFHKAYPLAGAFHLLDNITDEKALAGAIKRLSHIDPKLKTKYEAWRKMGLYEDVVQSRADYASMARSHHIGGDMIDRLFNRGAVEMDRGLFFYKAGELWTRRYSVAAAMERHIANGGKLETAQDIKSVMDKANVFMLNMHRTVKADWQKGILSIPTQFMQVHTKFIEALFGRNLTRAEKMKLMGGQVALFGSLGIPFGPYIGAQVMAGLGIEAGEMSDSQLEAVNNGITGLLVTELLGIENVVAQRGAIPFGIGDVVERLFDEQASWGEVLMGATGGMLDRTAQAMTNISRILSFGDFNPENYDERHVQAATVELLRILSTGRNAWAAYELHNNGLLSDPRGNPLIYSDDVNVQSMIAKGLGFEFNKVYDIYTMEQTERDVNQRVRDKIDALSIAFYKLYGSEERISEEDAERTYIAIESMLASESPETARRIIEGFKRRLLNPESRYDRATQAYIERIVDEMNTAQDLLIRNQEVFREGE